MVVIVIVALVLAFSWRGREQDVTLLPTSSSATPTGTPGETAGAEAASSTLTPLPIPSTTPGVENAAPGTSAPLASPTIAPRTPTPAPNPQLWRFEGVVVDPNGTPVEGVCVAIGPIGCRPYSPRSDDRGVYFVDFPQVNGIAYDLHFLKDGYAPFDVRVMPSGPTTFNVVLQPR